MLRLAQTAPPLLHFAGSWVIVNPETGQGVQETWSRANAEKAIRYGYRVETITDYLARINHEARP